MLDLLFETSWEVCNKVGGIYAVLSTKAKTLQQLYKDKVIFIGPDIWSPGNDSPFFIESKTLLSDWKKQAVFPSGMKVRIGTWDVPGKPMVILVDYKSLYSFKNELYAEMWNHFSVDSLHGYGDYDESCVFAYGAALVIESIVLWKRGVVKNVVAHFEEWTTGMGLLYVKRHLAGVATVFTTHATSVGRSICGNGKPLYDYMSCYNGDQMAGELNMQSKHSLEKAAALAADSFTTVSEVTARECEQLLGRRPLVTPNAFEQNFVPRGEKSVKARKLAREHMLKVAKALTGDNLDDSTMLIATSGRCEYRNKGIDVYLDALNVLRDQLNSLHSTKRKIVAFVLVPAWVESPRADLIASVKAGRTARLFNPIITHNLYDKEVDCIYTKMNFLGMHNEVGDSVKMIYVPSYLNGNDGIFNMTYYDLLPGLDITVFPSYYEPWGYTPLESSAFSVPTITTDLSGFGQWVLNNFTDGYKRIGVKVIHRTDSNYSDTVNEIVNGIENVYVMKEPEVRVLRKSAQTIAKAASWKNFINYYIDAYEKALVEADKRVYEDTF